MHPYTTHQIAEILDGVIQPKDAAAQAITQITHDSRRIPRVNGQIFVSLHGPRHDGHQYIAQAYQAGIRIFLVDKAFDWSSFPEATFIQIKNTNLGLQQWARHHRAQFAIPVIGITGSNGKTTVKEWLFQLLEEDHRIVRSPASYNSQIGVPLSVLQIEALDELGIFEAGISERGEMVTIAPIIDCTIGLITNIGTAHAAGFRDEREKVREKLQLFEQTQTIIYCKDHRTIADAVHSLERETFSWSTKEVADLTIEEIRAEKGLTHIQAQFHQQKLEIEIPFVDRASIENAIHCWAVMLFLELAPDSIQQRMNKLKRLELRLALRAGINQCTLIDDTYNADLTSLKNALQFLDQQPTRLKRSIILSDFLQSGLAPKQLYQEIAELLQGANISQLIGIGQQISTIAQFLPTAITTHFFPHTEAFLKTGVVDYFSNEVVLLKGARTYAFDRISNLLSAQQHRTVLEVNLEALSQNLAVFQRQLRSQTQIMVMVKAAAYGSGSVEVARRLAYLGVDYLAVAYVDEGIRLRQGGIQLPILVLNPEPSAFRAMQQFDLEPEVYSFRQLKEWQTLANQGTEIRKIHLKIDTGMSRLGFSTTDIEALLLHLAQHPTIRVVSVFTHLAASEDSKQDAFSLQQIKIFEEQYHRIEAVIGYRPLRHVLNSAGIARFPQYQMDMVRLGIGLYGILGGEAKIPHLQAVLTLKATISQLKWLKPGDTIGYGRAGTVSRPTHLATVSIGYADGLPRSIKGNHYRVYIQGQPAPIIGHVCMDMCMVDVTDIPEVQYKDEVIIFGKSPSVESLALATDRIVYEILTGISTRVQRLYTS